ncbi:hypothetical protein GCM10007161_11880 [Ignatzschineria indica]|uniref:Lipoprotein n=1 Tax=Ignatzschineria indica TaxID=472583 RepID=A0A2U2AK34_9GAMM|nr:MULTISPECIES: hypothetical protein [Ignatzschineria]OYQ79512.1 hypothetical protein B9T19_07040 [Ignatzschineria sp. F8392]PWD83194.1 hypothetical protein DC082_07220 [Ignatzschineria indica]GGZ82163.1 hypothetical protein GCM10007161_11880 [Ignatzschineria indica]
MKKFFAISSLSALILAGCATTEAPTKSVSYTDYKDNHKHDTELVSDKHYESYLACVRSGLKSHQVTESALKGNGARLQSGNHFVIEIYRAIDSTYARADSDDKRIIDLLHRCK